MGVTPFEELNDVLSTFLSLVRAELDDNFIGLYLQGSFAVGDADEFSDCDWIVVIREPIADPSGLQRMHERIFDFASPWAQHLEGSYFPAAALRARLPDAEPLLYLDNGSRLLERSDHDDTLVVRWSLREHGVTLAGPEPVTLIDPIGAEELRAEARRMMRAWSCSLVRNPTQMGELWYQRFTVICHCRFLRTLETGRVTSKREAAAWGTANLDPRWGKLIARSMAGRAQAYANPHQPADPVELAETLEFVRFVLRLAACES